MPYLFGVFHTASSTMSSDECTAYCRYVASSCQHADAVSTTASPSIAPLAAYRACASPKITCVQRFTLSHDHKARHGRPKARAACWAQGVTAVRQHFDDAMKFRFSGCGDGLLPAIPGRRFERLLLLCSPPSAEQRCQGLRLATGILSFAGAS